MADPVLRYWTDLAIAQYGPLDAGARVGQVTRTYRMGMDVQFPDGDSQFGTTDDKYRDPLTAPATGDWVIVSKPEQREYPLVVRIDHRTTQLVRRDPADRAAPQVMAANVDVVAIVHGADRPVNARRLWRALAVAGGSGAQVVMILTKADLPGGQAAAAAMAEAAPGVPVYVTASTRQDGVDAITALLARPDAAVATNEGREDSAHGGERGTTGHQNPPTCQGATMVLIGESGAGKSSLVNALLDREVVAVGAVRALDAKGRHTTTHRELLYLPEGGAVLDTPGVRAIGMWPGYVDCAVPFADVAAATADCRFANCTHRHEPGCGVQAGIADGTLDPERVAACFELIDEEAQVAHELATKHWR